ncbi:uncharacterized protein LOC128999361 isoform X1 [Macrosteles quadrilineatus]|uniref:uncharacterized protein LOC128999361 isoform X1 n=1 Tax=Macrosteles quadrilineatus TaxID=74068 RepID=UPI0023E1CC6E|nr:uncharacterized protein LOC128999361 isoform X1 [Macrosteles quadrilineatus]
MSLSYWPKGVQKKRPPRLVWEDDTDMPPPQSPSNNSCASSAVSVISERTKAVRAQYFFERRLLFVCTCLVGVAIVVWIASISTDFWFVVDGGEKGLWINETKRFFVRSHSGLFKYCRMAIGNATAGGKTTPKPPTAPTVDPSVEETATPLGNGTETSPRMLFYRKCKWHDVFPSDTKVKGDPMLDMAILNYTRTEIMFSIISLLVMTMGLFFSIYTFNNPRYTFKRLAGGIHFISCLSIFVVIEILMQSITYEKEFLPVVHPPKATYHYGWSYHLAWFVFLLNLFAGCAFMWYSKKRKRDKAPNEEVAMADEPTIIGR